MAKTGVFMLLLGAGLHGPAQAQFTYPNCNPLAAGDFKATEVFNKSGANGALGRDAGLAEPVQMDLHAVRNGGVLNHVDIYFVERLGKVKWYNGATKTVATLGTITVHGADDSGLMGIAVDPAFDQNRYLYVFFVPPATGTARRQLRLARYTVTAQNTLDMASQKLLFDIRGSNQDKWHSGGPMTFDRKGDLWLQIGNQSDDVDWPTAGTQYSQDSNSSDEWGPSCTNNLRGGTLRIHPDNSSKGYSVPAGNFGEYWAGQFQSQGNAALAAQYRDPAKVAPEVYIKGERSNYSIGVHPTKDWLVWGTVNFESSRDEFNITDHPIFSGFPYFHGNNERVPSQQQFLGYLVDAAKPLNKSALCSGVQELPPAIPGTISGLAGVAISGPIYSFDHGLNSPTKFPPHFNNHWIGFDFGGSMYMFTVDSANLKVTKQTRVDNGVLSALKLRSPVQAKYGPDGALYVLNYDGFYSTGNPAVTRVEYTGSCQLPVRTAPRALERGPGIFLGRDELLVREPGRHVLRLYDLGGKLRGQVSGAEGGRYSLARLRARWGLENGVYLLRLQTTQGLREQSLSLL